MGRRMADWIQSCGLALNIGSWPKVCPYPSCAQVEPFFLPVQAFLLHFYDLPPSPYSDGGLPLSQCSPAGAARQLASPKVLGKWLSGKS